MQRSSTFLWIILAFLLLLPSSLGRLLLDLFGGLMLVSLLIPLLLTGLGWIGWKVLQSNMITCEGCGARITKNSLSCPVCGLGLQKQSFDSQNQQSVPASSATIDVVAEDLDKNH